MIVLLRTLTEKSLIQAGKNANMLVGDLLQTRKIDLIYIYFNYSNITFTKEILQKLRIREEDYIEKPGKCPEKYHYYANRNTLISAKAIITKSQNLPNNDKDLIQSIAIKFKNKKIRNRYKSNLIGLEKREQIAFSKGALQRKNHRK